MSTKSSSFRAQLKTSSKFLSLRFVSSFGLRLVSTIVLTRLLAPEIYGVFAIVLVYIYILEMMSDFGLRSLILTREGDVTDAFLRTCWTFSILRGALVMVVSVLLGVVFAVVQNMGWFAPESSYAAVDLPYAIAAIGLGSFIFGFESPLRVMHERRMEFGRVTAVDLIRNVITLVVMISLAIYFRSVWALVVGQIIRAAVHVVLSFMFFTGPRMAWSLDKVSRKVIIDRGKWVVGESALTALSKSLDRIFLGLVMNSTTFGFYYIARQLVDLVPEFLQELNSAMSLQVFRKLHASTPEEFRKNYYRYRIVLDAAAGLVAGGLIVLAPLMVEILFDDRYAGVAPIMQVLSLSTLIIGALVLRNAFVAQQRYDFSAKLSVISTAGLFFGLAFVTLVVSSTQLVLFVVALHRLPEAIIITVMGMRKDWVVLWREFIVLGIFAIGVFLGFGVLSVWNWLF